MSNIVNKSMILGLMLLLVAGGCTTENKPTTSVIQTQSQNTDNQSVKSNKPATSHTIPSSQNHLNTGGMEWMTMKDAANSKNAGNKKYLVDVYTEWCGWCKVMDKKTFTDPVIQQYLKENFNIVKFDAEQKESISFKNKDYEWVGSGRKGINKLAIELLGSNMSYPTLVFLDENMNKIKSSPGYKNPDQLMQELRVIAGS